ncbi:hypothetical protein BX600DRAFT_470094 [Xylariales sp. PMI_506]|nr:hypothetical protein BX600DRAFT_470094 [Xylariales sp. PMI_506]
MENIFPCPLHASLPTGIAYTVTLLSNLLCRISVESMMLIQLIWLFVLAALLFIPRFSSNFYSDSRFLLRLLTSLRYGVDVDYLRHARSESNRSGNQGVHILDPPLLSGSEDHKSGHLGRAYCETVLRPMLQSKSYTHIAVSPLTRTLSTLLQSVSLDVLSNATILLQPLLIEQTVWFSDRCRSTKEIIELIRLELRARGAEHLIPHLKIDFTLMLQDSGDTERVYERLEGANKEEMARMRNEHVLLAESEKLNKGWHTKTSLYSPERVHERGVKCCEELVKWAKIASRSTIHPKFLIVGHGGFVSFLAEEVGDIRPYDRPPRLSVWETGELRKYNLRWGFHHGIFGYLLREDKRSRIERLGVAHLNGNTSYDLAAERQKAEEQRQCIIELARNCSLDPAWGETYKEANTYIPSKLIGSGIEYLTRQFATSETAVC